MIFDVLEAVLGSPTKIKLLRALLPLAVPVSGRDAERLAGVVSRSAAGRALQELAQLQILERESHARVHLFRVNRRHELVPALEHLFDAEFQRFARLREILEEAFNAAELRDAVESAVVFGSAARGEARPDSDLDLFVVVRHAAHKEGVSDVLLGLTDSVRERLGLRLEPLVLPLSRVRERYKDGDPLMKNILDEGRTLFGRPFRELVG